MIEVLKMNKHSHPQIFNNQIGLIPIIELRRNYGESIMDGCDWILILRIADKEKFHSNLPENHDEANSHICNHLGIDDGAYYAGPGRYFEHAAHVSVKEHIVKISKFVGYDV